MKTGELPVFSVSDVHPDSPQLTGKVDRWHWVGEGHIVYLLLDDGLLVEGKFRNIREATKSVSFAFREPDSAPHIRAGESIRYLDGYWGERALIVLDRSLIWQELTFEPRDATRIHLDGKKEEIPGGWDHEHCAICWAKISQHEKPVFMESSEDDCVCLDCFRNHVEARSIDFAEEA